MEIVKIASSAGSYDVVCEVGSLALARDLIGRMDGESSGVYVLSSPRVWESWGKKVHRALALNAAKRVVLFDDSESAKRLATVEKITRALVRAGADRGSFLVAVGGGVVGDVGGFAAASYLRGVKLAHIPTTVVAQVDSSIGGKTGVDLPEGKNLVGAFYPPKLVVTDPSFLRTLPHREFRSGLYEVVKYGVIADREMFEYLVNHMATVLRRDEAAIGWLILRSIRIKADVVEKDEHESGLRKILNFGHTLGHALETATNYKRFKHGEAIAWGMIAATMMALGVDLLGDEDARRIIRLVASVGPLPSLARITMAQLKPILAGDKKARGGRVRWVLPNRIGNTQWDCEVPWPVVSRVFTSLPEIFAKARG